MKITTLSVLTAIALSATSASALTLFQDPVTGQVFTKAADGRVPMGDFIDAKTVYEENQAQDSAAMKKEVKKKGNKITIMRDDSPEFLLGKETNINMKFVPEDNTDMWFKAGVRIQGTMEDVDSDQSGTSQDAYLRRTRFEAQAGFGKHASFVMDIRNDKVNIDQKGEQTFNVGDAYVKIKKPFDTSLLNFKLYRAKIDVSRTETVKSARVIAYDRPKVADYAAQYISHNRRGTNIQAYGDWEKKVHYQIAAGDSVFQGSVEDAQGNDFDDKGGEITKSSFFYGGKIVLSPFDGWEETQRTETYMGEGKHFEIGAGYWAVNSVQVDSDQGGTADLSHELINLEMSAHYKGFFVQAEYFKMDDVVENIDKTGALNIGKSNGWYATSEYVMKDFYYIAPFVRYEDWDKFEGESGYDYEAKIAGVNWYLRGNTTKVGLYVQKETFGDKISDNGTSEEDVTTIRLTSQWFF